MADEDLLVTGKQRLARQLTAGSADVSGFRSLDPRASGLPARAANQPEVVAIIAERGEADPQAVVVTDQAGSIRVQVSKPFAGYPLV